MHYDKSFSKNNLEIVILCTVGKMKGKNSLILEERLRKRLFMEDLTAGKIRVTFKTNKNYTIDMKTQVRSCIFVLFYFYIYFFYFYIMCL